MSGNPGGTSRDLTMAQYDDERDDKPVREVMYRSELRGYVTQYQERGAEERRQSNDLLFGTENGLKVFKGRHEALADKAFHDQLAANERAFRARVMADPALAQAYGVWDAIAELVRKDNASRTEYRALERGIRCSSLFTIARNLLRHGDEIAKPHGERLREFGDSRLPQMKARRSPTSRSTTSSRSRCRRGR